MIIDKFLYDALIGAPMTLIKDILEKLRDEVDRERLITEESIKERLQQLQIMLSNGEMNEEEYDDVEAMLIERLRAVRKYREDDR